MALYGLYGRATRDFLTVGGRVLVHSNRAEMEWLFPGSLVREVPPTFPPGQTLPLDQHPDLVGVVTFPLTKEQFRV